MRTDKQTLARKRNWTLLRLTGARSVFGPQNPYTEAELETCTKIQNLIDTLLDTWIIENNRLGIKKRSKNRFDEEF